MNVKKGGMNTKIINNNSVNKKLAQLHITYILYSQNYINYLQTKKNYVIFI